MDIPTFYSVKFSLNEEKQTINLKKLSTMEKGFTNHEKRSKREEKRRGGRLG